VLVNQACYNVDPDPCIQQGLNLISNLKRDMFVISTYPYEIVPPEMFTPDWFSRVFKFLTNETFAIGETGQSTDSVTFTGPSPPQMIVYFVLIVLGFGLFLPCGIWFCACVLRSRKYSYEFFTLDSPTPTPKSPPSKNLFKRYALVSVNCLCCPSKTQYNKARIVTMILGFSIMSLFWIIGFSLMYAPTCTTVMPSSEAAAASYLQFVVQQANIYKMPFVVWWSNRDLIPEDFMTSCPCDDSGDSAVFCNYVANNKWNPYAYFINQLSLKVFGTMGLREYDGTPKPLLSILQTAMANCSAI